MKKFYFLVSITLTVFVANAQNPIPNPGFETGWSGGVPNNWTDSRDINQTTPGCSIGQHSAQGLKSSTTYPAFITSANNVGFPVSTNYSYFHLYCGFNRMGSDILTLNVSVFNASNSQIGFGALQIGTATTGCQYFTIQISYSTGTAARAIITVLMNSSTGGNPTIGSSFTLDNLSLDNSSTGIEEIERDAAALRVFPNPANDFVRIYDESINGKATVTITNILGEKVKQMSELDFSTHPIINISDLPAGNYVVAVKHDDIIQTKRLVVE